VSAYWVLEESEGPKGQRFCRDPLYRGGLDVIRKEAWPFYRTISGVRLYWVLEEPKGPKGFEPDFNVCLVKLSGSALRE